MGAGLGFCCCAEPELLFECGSKCTIGKMKVFKDNLRIPLSTFVSKGLHFLHVIFTDERERVIPKTFGYYFHEYFLSYQGSSNGYLYFSRPLIARKESFDFTSVVVCIREN